MLSWPVLVRVGLPVIARLALACLFRVKEAPSMVYVGHQTGPQRAGRSLQMWSPLSSIFAKSLNCRFVMPDFWEILDQLIMAWIV